MLPDSEITAFLMTVDDSVGLAAEGQLADGYAVLVAGLRRAEDAQEAGEPWADELARRYRLATDNYGASYGVSLD